MAKGTSEMPATVKSSFREEYCPSHVQVEWEVSYEALQTCGDTLRSPVFKIGRQSYALESQWNTSYLKLSLLRMGPSIKESSFEGQFWGGLKRADGDYDHKYKSGAPRLKPEHRSFELETSLGDHWKTYLDRLCVTQDGRLKFFFRMNIKTPVVGLETCTHGTPRMLYPQEGEIRQKECSHHQHVEWNFIFGIHKGQTGDSTSHVFKIGSQMYFFKLLVDKYHIEIFLYRVGRSVDGPAADVRYWIGFKWRDGAYNHRNFSDKLDLSEEFSLWTPAAEHSFYCSDFEHYLTQDSRHTLFLRMNSTGVYLCSQDKPVQIAPQSTGEIREEQCYSHKQVEWDFGYKVSQDVAIILTSPVFEIGTQAFFFETSIDNDGDISARLFRLGRSVRGPASTPRCWVGFKFSDGTYDYEMKNLQLNLQEDFGLWAEVDFFMFISESRVKEAYLTSDSRLTFFFRINTQPTGQQMCTHGTSDMPSSVTGRIREVACSSHREVEWDIDCEVPLEDKLIFTSPAFKIDTQMYHLELFHIRKYWDILFLYRLGRSVEGPSSSIRCWAGLKHTDGTYPLTNFSEIFDLHDDFELWTLVTETKDLPKFDDNALKYIKKLTFFFRMNVESKGTEKCTHGPIDWYAPSGEGRIEIQVCPTHNHVLWDVSYEASHERVCSTTSPVFTVGNQWYHLKVCYDSEEPVTLKLYRSGYPVQGPASCVHCWAGLKSGDGSYHHHIQKEEVDLREDLSLPTHVASFIFPDRPDLESTHVSSDGHLNFFIQLNVPQVTFEEVTCAHGAVQMCPPGKGSIREIKDNLVEWDVGYEDPREYTHFSTSPVFKMGMQCYLLEFCYEIDGILALSLYRFGRSVEGLAGSVRCWAGLKRDRSLYHHNIEGVEFDLGRDCELWTKVRILGYFRRFELENQCLTKNGRLTFLCLICAEDRESKAVAVQPDGNRKSGHEDRLSVDSEDFKKLRQDFRLWLEHPEEGERIRRRRREEFEAKQWNVLEKDDKEPWIFAA